MEVFVDHAFIYKIPILSHSRNLACVFLASKYERAWQLMSIEAMGCQKEIAEKIMDKKADYLLAVKKNQRTLFETVQTAFEAAQSGIWPVELPERRRTDKDHDRMENRRYSVVTQPELLSSLEGWKNISCIGKVTRHCEEGSKAAEETRYFISSRKLDVEIFSDTVRSHWGIENSLHWVLDIVFCEDEGRAREKNSAANFVTLKHITLNMLKSLQGKQSRRVRLKLGGWDEEYLYKVLCATPV